MKIPKLGNSQERSIITFVPCLVPTAWCVGALGSILLGHGTVLFNTPGKPSLPAALQPPTWPSSSVIYARAGGLSLRAQLGHRPSAGSRPSISAVPSLTSS